MKLSKRLQAIADLIEKYKQGSILADIGTDHAYLPCYLVSHNIVDFAYACDIAKGPLQASIDTIESYNLIGQVNPLLGGGLMPIVDKKVDMISICGMGGKLTIDILAEHLSYIKDQYLFLQSNIGVDLLREFLNDNSFEIIDEALVKDANHIYEILVVKRGKKQDLTHLDYIFGPILRQHKTDLYKEKWTYQYNIQNKILESLDKNHIKYKEVYDFKTLIEGEIYDCK